MAYRVLEDASRNNADIVVPIINARRHQTYAGSWNVIFAMDAGILSLTELHEEKQYMIEELLGQLKETGSVIYFTGDGIDAYESIIRETLPQGSYILAGEDLRYQHAGAVAERALKYARAGRTVAYDDLMPEYMRLAEAEMRLKEGTLSDKIRRTIK